MEKTTKKYMLINSVNSCAGCRDPHFQYCNGNKFARNKKEAVIYTDLELAKKHLKYAKKAGYKKAFLGVVT